MNKIGTVLKNFVESEQTFAAVPNTADGFDSATFFRSATAYYPGSSNDGFLIEHLNKAHACSKFIYVDYFGFDLDKLQTGLKDKAAGYKFNGYRLVKSQSLHQSQLLSRPFRPSVSVDASCMYFVSDRPGFALWAKFEKESSEVSGADFFEILFVHGDGIATYDALFSPQNGAYPTPLVVLVEDYGFGGNYDSFGKGGLLEKIAKTNGICPEFLIVGNHFDISPLQNYGPWQNYVWMSEVESEFGGMHKHERRLYRKSPMPDQATGEIDLR